MSRYIDADELLELYDIDDLEEDVDWKIPIEVVKQNIKDIPSADVEPVRHGHWINDIGYAGWTCSECGNHEGNKTDKYCSNCGAKMDKEQKHD